MSMANKVIHLFNVTYPYLLIVLFLSAVYIKIEKTILFLATSTKQLKRYVMIYNYYTNSKHKLEMSVSLELLLFKEEEL